MKKGFLLLLGVLILVVITPLIYPKPLFSYSVTGDGLSVYSDTPIPEEKAEIFLKEVKERLQNAPIQHPIASMQIYVANIAWHRNWLWLIHRGAQVGGFIVAPLTGEHTFFSGADFETGELISPSGYRPYPPRTLVYYGAHELTHVVTSKKIGWYRFFKMPVWVREGLADYVAMPRESVDTLFSKIGKKKLDISMMKKHGVYAPYRLLVTYFLEEADWSIDTLLESDLTLQDAQEIVFKSLENKKEAG